MVHVLESTQRIHIPIERAWEFFSNPRNLAKITPPEMNFTICSGIADRIYTGMMIAYRVRPLLGIPIRWLTEITHIDPAKFFIDEQRMGPYRLWHHEHHFKAIGNDGVEMTDRVTYALPFGPLGDIWHPILVAPQLSKIFSYREEAIRRIFPESQP